MQTNVNPAKMAILLTMLLFSGCMALPPMQPDSGTVAMDKPRHGEALVYFMRATKSDDGRIPEDSSVPLVISNGGVSIGALRPGSYFVYGANPGVRTFSEVGAKTPLTLTVKAGSVYYVRVTLYQAPQRANLIFPLFTPNTTGNLAATAAQAAFQAEYGTVIMHSFFKQEPRQSATRLLSSLRRMKIATAGRQ
jgi:hypothetical protein